MAKPTFDLNQYVFQLCFEIHIPFEITTVAENLLAAIPGIYEVEVHHDWAEIKVLKEDVDEMEDEREFWATLKKHALEVADVTRTACLLLDKVEEKKR